MLQMIQTAQRSGANHGHHQHPWFVCRAKFYKLASARFQPPSEKLGRRILLMLSQMINQAGAGVPWSKPLD